MENSQTVVSLTLNACKLAKRGKGVKDEFYTANLIGKQDIEVKFNRKGESVEDREITYDHIKPEHTDLLLAEMDKIANKHIYLAKVLDLFKAEEARTASNPLPSLTSLILKDGILTKDENSARQKAQAIMFQAKSNGFTVEEVYEMTCTMVKAKEEKAKAEALAKAEAALKSLTEDAEVKE